MTTRAVLTMTALAGAAAVADGLAAGGVAGTCTPGTGPDVIVGELSGILSFGTVGEITAYAIGTTSCNIGDLPLLWDNDTANHPVIAQNLYRLHEGRFEQIGMSWLKHGFAALTENLCCTCRNPGTNQLLGVGCSDPYSAGLNGDQNGFPGCGGFCGGLGPRYQVNAATGVFAWPYDGAGQSGDVIYKRLQVHNADLDPEANPGATYYGEGHYVTPDDAAAGNHHNNASYDEVLVGSFNGSGWNLGLAGDTRRGLPAIFAWPQHDPAVVVETLDDGSLGRFHLAARATDNGDGTWHYEYALHNLNSHRAAASFRVPAVGAPVNLGFHDVDYHSGDGEGGVTYDGTDWPAAVQAGSVTWSTTPFAENPNANALRWGTLYNFRFDTDAPPGEVTAVVGLFRGGVPSSLTATVPGPQAPCPWDCGDGDGTVNIVDFLELLAQWGSAGTSCDLGVGAPGAGIEDLLDMLVHWGPCG